MNLLAAANTHWRSLSLPNASATCPNPKGNSSGSFSSKTAVK
ncbi:hypothetical protein [Pseudanabaena sp. FACHB-1998]|nr:hypothetical protein [Pseudanabaena sp. FACHB-1998]